MGAGHWREVSGPNANTLGAGSSPSPTEGQGETGQAPQALLFPKYFSSLKCHHESPLWFKMFGIPYGILLLKCTEVGHLGGSVS